jgi:hypothetical protein
MPRVHGDMEIFGGKVTAVRFGTLDEEEQDRAPSLDWQTGEVPEGLEVLFYHRDYAISKEQKTPKIGIRDGDCLTHYKTHKTTYVVDGDYVTRWIPLADLLRVIGGGE